MILNKTLLNNLLWILLLTIFTLSCSKSYEYRRLPKKKPSPSIPEYTEPLKKQSEALSIYRSAVAFEDEYYDTKSEKMAEIAGILHICPKVVHTFGNFKKVRFLSCIKFLYRTGCCKC
jgi:hypothetical protein